MSVIKKFKEAKHSFAFFVSEKSVRAFGAASLAVTVTACTVTPGSLVCTGPADQYLGAVQGSDGNYYAQVTSPTNTTSYISVDETQRRAKQALAIVKSGQDDPCNDVNSELLTMQRATSDLIYDESMKSLGKPASVPQVVFPAPTK